MARHDPIQALNFADCSPVLWQGLASLFRKDSAASGLTDWSRMSRDLYKFRTRLPQQQQFQPLTTSSSPSRSMASSSIFSRSLNNGSCAWPYGQCRYRHRCEKCEGEHPCVNCPFLASALLAQRSRSSSPPRSKRQRRWDHDQVVHISSEQCK